jgi:hypothetical protein
MNKLEGPLSSALSVIGGVHIGAKALHVLNLIWLALSLSYPSGEEGGNFLVQMISTCVPSREGGAWGSAL